MEKRRRSNKERTEAMRAALIKAARDLFVEQGYAETGTPDIVRKAGATRGALYHHFEDKADLFRAVVRAELEAVARDIDVAAIKSDDASAALEAGAAGFMQAMAAPGRARLILLDGPAVLGRAEIDAMDRETSGSTLRVGLATAMEAGAIRELPVDPLTDLLSAMFDRAALAAAEGVDADSYRAVISALMAGLSR